MRASRHLAIQDQRVAAARRSGRRQRLRIAVRNRRIMDAFKGNWLRYGVGDGDNRRGIRSRLRSSRSRNRGDFCIRPRDRRRSGTEDRCPATARAHGGDACAADPQQGQETQYGSGRNALAVIGIGDRSQTGFVSGDRLRARYRWRGIERRGNRIDLSRCVRTGAVGAARRRRNRIC